MVYVCTSTVQCHHCTHSITHAGSVHNMMLKEDLQREEGCKQLQHDCRAKLHSAGLQCSLHSHKNGNNDGDTPMYGDTVQMTKVLQSSDAAE